MYVDDLACTRRVRHTKWKAKGVVRSPYVLDQSVALSHSWRVVRLKTLPISGSGFGPGGLGNPEPGFLLK